MGHSGGEKKMIKKKGGTSGRKLLPENQPKAIEHTPAKGSQED